MKKGLTILFGVVIAIIASHETFAQSDFPEFGQSQLENRIELYPNPAVDYINIEIKESRLVETHIVLHNIIGNEIEIMPEKITENKYRLDVKDLQPGYYLLSIKDPVSDFTKTYKFLKR